jgi:ADP-ribose pyrophosphatase
MANTPESLDSELIYKGKVFDIRVDDIRDGRITYKREIVVHKGSAVVIPVFEDGTAALVRQYRHAAGKHLLEICAGTLNGNEDPELGARRELEEEIGVRAGKIEKLCEFWVSPGFLTEKMHLYLATDLTETAQNLEHDEILTVERHPIGDLLKMVQNGEIEDAKTMIGINLAVTQIGKS